MHVLITKDANNKIRVVELDAYWNKLEKGYTITRVTYQLGGKQTEQPSLLISEGKANRTIKEQTTLEYKSILKKYLDKGYKLLSKPLDAYTEIELHNKVGEIVTDANGFRKHMKAKQADKCKDSTIENVVCWYASRKVDGLRCSFNWDGKEIRSASRGGGDYDVATIPFRKHPKFIHFFREHPDYILDGELYKHGKSLQQISGEARREKDIFGSNWLEYYIYDIMFADMLCKDRMELLDEIAQELNLSFDPEREWLDDELRIQMLPQVIVKGSDKKQQIQQLHDEYVKEGWEGCVIRDASKPYKFGGRGQDMIKFKSYKDDEFEITGISEGLRLEDMCFTLKTKDNIEFKAKPMGSRELKEQYREDLPKLIGKMATVKYFYLSDDGTPLQPTLKAIRDYENT